MSETKNVQEGSFWDNWSDRFVKERNKYITPFNSAVKSELDNIDLCGSCGDWKDIVSIWSYVFNNYEYELSKEWKKPKQTIAKGVGDCEDLDFLTASLIMSDSVDEIELVLGYLIYKDGSKAEHTWLRYNGKTIDPTGTPEMVSNLSYNEIKSFEIVFGDNND